MSYLITAIAFIVIFSLLVLIHEWGHYYMARRARIRVEEFGFGLPPRAMTLFEKDGTKFTLNWIPFGGFVRMYGEDDFSEKSAHDPKSFQSKTKLQRTGVIVAGVFMNYVLAILLLTIGFTAGMRPLILSAEELEQGVIDGSIPVEMRLLVTNVATESPAAQAGIQVDDELISINGTPLKGLSQLEQFSGTEVREYRVKRGEEEIALNITPNPEGKVGVTLQRDLQDILPVQYPFPQSLGVAFSESWRLTVRTVEMLGEVIGSLIQKQEVPEGVSGPVGILRATHYSAQEGIIPLIQLCALLSLSLAVINIMPFPALDGGRLLFIIAEIITFRRINQKTEAYIHGIGFILLLLFIFAITWNDIVSWIGG